MQGHLLAIREATFPGFRLGPFPAAGEEVRCSLDSDSQERSVNQRGSERSHIVQLSGMTWIQHCLILMPLLMNVFYEGEELL